MEDNFIQMAASTVHAVAYTIGPIFKHIIDCVQLYFTNANLKVQSFRLITENNFIQMAASPCNRLQDQSNY